MALQQHSLPTPLTTPCSPLPALLPLAYPPLAPLQRVMPQASKSLPALAAKITIDQFIFAPLCTAAFYFFKVATEGRPRWVRGCELRGMRWMQAAREQAVCEPP